jgi:hypothetical protein
MSKFSVLLSFDAGAVANVCHEAGDKAGAVRRRKRVMQTYMAAIWAAFAFHCVVSSDANARDTPPDHRSTPRHRVEMASTEVRRAAADCLGAAMVRGELGWIHIELTDGLHAPLFRIVFTPPISPATRACVMASLEAARLPVEQATGTAASEHGAGVSARIAVGRAPPFPAAIVPLWLHYIREPSEEAARALESAVPSYLVLDKKGCLGVADLPEVAEPVGRWLDTMPRISPFWLEALERFIPRRLRDARFVSHLGELMLVVVAAPAPVNQGGQLAVICGMPGGRAGERVRAQLGEVFSCIPDSIEAALVAPQVVFPSDRKYVQVAQLGARACAITDAGAVTCCGASTSELRSLFAARGCTAVVAADANGFCALCAGSVVCSSGSRFRAPDLVDLLVVDGSLCGRTRSNSYRCLEGRRGRHAFKKGVSDVAASSTAPVHCGKTAKGVWHCSDSDIEYLFQGNVAIGTMRYIEYPHLAKFTTGTVRCGSIGGTLKCLDREGRRVTTAISGLPGDTPYLLSPKGLCFAPFASGGGVECAQHPLSSAVRSGPFGGEDVRRLAGTDGVCTLTRAHAARCVLGEVLPPGVFGVAKEE